MSAIKHPDRIWATGTEKTGSWNTTPINPLVAPPQTEYTRADLSDAKDTRINELDAKLAKAIGALTSIEKWAGEFSPTNKFWPHGKPMSYVAAYGSNGERDFMREKARTIIAEIQGNP